MSESTLAALRVAVAAAGVEFIKQNGGNHGVPLRRPSQVSQGGEL